VFQCQCTRGTSFDLPMGRLGFAHLWLIGGAYVKRESLDGKCVFKRGLGLPT